MKTRKKRNKRRVDLHARHVRRVHAVMKALGVNEQYERLKPAERDHVLKFQGPTPQVVLADIHEEDPHAKHVAREIAEALNVSLVEIAGTTAWIPLKDFFRVAEPLASLFGYLQSRNAGSPRFDALAKAFYEVNDLIEKTFEDALSTLLNTIWQVLLDNSAIDERTYWLQLPDRSKWTPDCWKFVLHYEPAQIEREERGTASQILYRSGTADLGEMGWITWTGDQLGLADADQELPVYLSKHALRQFRDRIPAANVGNHAEQYMLDSLMDPVFVEGDSDTRLVEFRLPPGKLGYFVVDVAEDKVILRTFLFLTMNGTPEGNQLYEKLRLNRNDKEYLELDKLPTYLFSDIKQDAELRQAFEECGCGHLLTMTPEEYVNPRMMERGHEVRKYLGGRLDRLLNESQAQAYGM